MRKYLTTLSLLALCAGSFESAAKADVVYVTVTGTVAAGRAGSTIDSGGLFGTAGTDLTGDVYTAQYTFDTSLGTVSSSPTENYAIGGSSAYVADASPSLGTTLTINGHSVSFVGSVLGEIYGFNDGASTESYVAAVGNDPADPNFLIELYNYMYGYPGTSPASINTSYTIYSTDNIAGGSFADGSLSFNLLPAVYTEYDPSVSNVPEPASMALLGVGLLGLVVARRRTQSALAVR